MVGSDIGDINSPTNAGSRSTRVQISLETDENGGTSSGYFVTGLVSSMTQLRNGWTKQPNAPGELGEAVPDRRETDKALYMSLAWCARTRLWMW